MAERLRKPQPGDLYEHTQPEPPLRQPCGWCGQPALIRPDGIRCACTPALSAAEHLALIHAQQAKEAA